MSYTHLISNSVNTEHKYNISFLNESSIDITLPRDNEYYNIHNNIDKIIRIKIAIKELKGIELKNQQLWCLEPYKWLCIYCDYDYMIDTTKFETVYIKYKNKVTQIDIPNALINEFDINIRHLIKRFNIRMVVCKLFDLKPFDIIIISNDDNPDIWDIKEINIPTNNKPLGNNLVNSDILNFGNEQCIHLPDDTDEYIEVKSTETRKLLLNMQIYGYNYLFSEEEGKCISYSKIMCRDTTCLYIDEIERLHNY